MAYSVLVFTGGVVFREKIRSALLDLTGSSSSRSAVTAFLDAPFNLGRALLASEAVERIHIDIAFKHLTKIQAKRQEALRLGVLMTSSADLVPAVIRHRQRSIPVKLRLKGDWADHFESDKWSFRIHTRKGDQLFGMRRFSIQAPSTRGFQAEPIAFAHLRREGVLAPRYFFLNVTVNGKDVGLMALEEHFSKELLEAQERRDGVIIRFDEDAFFGNHARNGTFGPYGNALVAVVRPFRSSRVHKSETLSSNLETATGLLRGFLKGELPAADVFDVDLVARFLAVAEVWRASHMLTWHNLRFYFNPITQRLEPVGFDANLQVPYLGLGLVARWRSLSSRLLEDPELRSLFIQHLGRLADETVAGETQKWMSELEQPLLRVLHREFPFHFRMNLDPMIARARQLQKITDENFGHYEPYLGHPDMTYPEPLRAFLYAEASKPYLELVNTLPVPVTVTSIRFTGLPPDQAVEFHAEPPRTLPILVAPTGHGEAPSPVEVGFESPPGALDFGIEGTVRVGGQDRRYAFRAEPYYVPLARNPIPSATLDEILSQHSYLLWNAERGILELRPGVWNIRQSLVLPENLGLSIPAGTTLRFTADAALIASGPLFFTGTPGRPVILEGMPGPEGRSGWPGIVVLRSEIPYAWAHVIVRDTLGIDRDGWILTGGVTLHQSEVSIEDTLFDGNRTEDALNLIRSRFVLKNVSFKDAPSDALDADFSDGRIEGGHYQRIGGDAIDVSGSEVAIRSVRLEDIHDKAVSAGEESRVTAQELSIERVGTGVVSKDRSSLVLKDSEIRDAVHAGVMAYVKKPEYGPSELIARNLSVQGVGTPAAAQTGSRIVLNGNDVEPQPMDVRALYVAGPMRK
jgi:hypothetical protein